MSKNKTAIGITALVALIVVPTIFIIQGWVISLVWGWTVVPLFSVPQLSIAGAIGLSVLATIFQPLPVKAKDLGLEDNLAWVLVLFRWVSAVTISYICFLFI